MFFNRGCEKSFCALCIDRTGITRRPGGTEKCPLFGFDAHREDVLKIVGDYSGLNADYKTAKEVLGINDGGPDWWSDPSLVVLG